MTLIVNGAGISISMSWLSVACLVVIALAVWWLRSDLPPMEEQ